jgi:hypothetical protein
MPSFIAGREDFSSLWLKRETLYEYNPFSLHRKLSTFSLIPLEIADQNQRFFK